MSSWLRSILNVVAAGARVGEFNFDLARAAATYDIATASGRILILEVIPYNDVAAAGLTSITIQTNDTTPTTLLGSTLLAALTGGKSLTAFITRTVLGSGKKIRGTIVGTGTAGSIKVAVLYVPLSATATLS
jgi:hypothetical protein